jgi:hypothetical protein
MTIEYWKEVKERLVAIRKIDCDCNLVFGSKGHKYKPLGSVSQEEIKSFQVENGMDLPRDYRDFLLVVGGGPGPDYGIYSFEKVKSYSPNVSRVFSLTESTEWPESEDDPIWDLPGLLNISTSGCAIDWYIEVNGSQPGTMWVDSGPGWELTKADSFINWYSSWLNRIEKGLLDYVELKKMVKSKSKLSDIESKLNIESKNFKWDGFEYKRFGGIPGRLTLKGDRVVSMDLGPCWIN